MLRKISRGNAKDTTPNNSRNPIKGTLADCKPMKGALLELANMVDLEGTTDKSSSGSENTIQRSQADIGEAKIDKEKSNSQVG